MRLFTLRLLVPKQYRVTGGERGGDGSADGLGTHGGIRLHDAALEELYRRHRAAVLGFAARRARTPDEVVDLVGAVRLEIIASLALPSRNRLAMSATVVKAVPCAARI